MKMAVLTSDALHMNDSLVQGVKTVQIESEINYTLLLALVTRYRIDTLWVLSSVHSEGIPDYLGYKIIPSKRKNGVVQAWRMWKTEGTSDERRTIRVILLQLSRQWDFHKETDGIGLLTSLAKLSKQGVVFELSPGGTGRSLIVGRTRAEWLKPADLSKLPEAFSHAPSFKRALTADECKKKYLHVYDKSAQFLRACTGVELGVGTPLYIGSSTECQRLFKERVPGLWQVTANGETAWIWTPLVHYWRRCGVSVVFHDAYIWQEHHTILRDWGTYLWNVRKAVAGDSRAKGTNKKFYTQGLGWLRMREEKNRDVHDDLFRPDWHETLKEHAFCLIRYKVDALRAKGYDACWCNVDEIGFLSDEIDPLKAIPGLATAEAEAEAEPGGFTSKYGGAILVTDEVLAAFDESTTYGDAQKILYHAGQEVKKHG